MGRDSVWEDEKVLEMGDGDGCTAMWMYLLSLICTLQMVRMILFMLHIFYHNLLKERS
jgi:hypothetical protein